MTKPIKTTKKATRKPKLPMAVPEPAVIDVAPTCECCGEPAGEGNALCPACVASRSVPVAPTVASTVTRTRKPKEWPPVNPELIVAVRAHAVKHYEDHTGWGYVEAYTDEAIAEVIRWAIYPRGAINLMARVIKLQNSHRKDIQGAPGLDGQAAIAS